VNVASNETKKQQLETASDRLMAEAATVRRLEAEKRTHPISTPEFHALADKIADHARHVFRLADDEEEMGDEIPTGRDTIDDVARRQ
jgi:hypothetical protein